MSEESPAVGGVFLASEDPPRLTRWYRALGFPLNEDGFCVTGAAGPEASPASGTVFSIMPAQRELPAHDDSVEEEPYGRRRLTLNLRVARLDGVISTLRERGEIVAGPRDYGYGRFAWVRDPDGNLVEIWEPTAPAKDSPP